MREIGFERVFLLPHSAEEDIFRPLPPKVEFAHDVYLAGTANIPAEREVEVRSKGWSEVMWRIAEEIITLRREKRGYVDIFDELRKRMEDGIFTKEFFDLANALTLFQKSYDREELFECLRNYEIHVYGRAPSGKRGRVHFHRELEYTELPYLYSSGKISLNTVHYPRNCHQRIFHAAACRGFILTEYKEDIERFFDVGSEVICYHSLDELPSLIDYFLKNDKERVRISERAYRRFLSEHTSFRRMGELLGAIKDLL
jgi:spore maturation protein CgeB